MAYTRLRPKFTYFIQNHFWNLKMKLKEGGVKFNNNNANFDNFWIVEAIVLTIVQFTFGKDLHSTASLTSLRKLEKFKMTTTVLLDL